MGDNKLFQNATELLEPETVEIVGNELPSYVNGLVVRNGPGKFDLPSGFTMNNFYDGYAILTRIEIKNGKSVTLTKKYLDSEAHRKAVTAGKPCVLEFCTRSYADPEKSVLFRHLPDLIPVCSDNGNTGIYKIGKEVFTCAETCMFQNIDPNTLTIKERFDSNAVFGIAVSTTHPLKDPDTGLVYNVGPSMLTGLKYHMVKMDPTAGDLAETFKKAELFGGIPSSSLTKFGYQHSFGMTENYFVLIEQPYHTSIPKVIGSALKAGKSIWDLNGWSKTFKNRFHILSKSTGKPVSAVEIRAETPFYYLHFINCHELKKGDKITHVVVDIFTYPNLAVMECCAISALRLNNQVQDSVSNTQRFVVPILESLPDVTDKVNLNEGLDTKAKATRIDKVVSLVPENLTLPGIEFPTMNPARVGKPNKYFYGSSAFCKLGSFSNAVVKVNTFASEVVTYKGSDDVAMSEAIFVANPEGTAEDDGVLIVLACHSNEASQDYVVFLDAKNMNEIGRATFSTSLAIACHGLHIPAS